MDETSPDNGGSMDKTVYFNMIADTMRLRRMTLQEMAAEFGVTLHTIAAICRDKQITLPNKPELKRREYAEYVAENRCSALAAAAHFGVYEGTIWKACCEWDVEVEPQHLSGEAPPQGFSETALSSYRILGLLQNTRLTYEEIGHQVGTSRQRVHQIKARATAAGMVVREESASCEAEQEKLND